MPHFSEVLGLLSIPGQWMISGSTRGGPGGSYREPEFSPCPPHGETVRRGGEEWSPVVSYVSDRPVELMMSFQNPISFRTMDMAGRRDAIIPP